MKTKILKYLCYFDIFNHPIKREEIAMLLGENEAVVDQEIKGLEQEGVVYLKEDYCAIQPEIEGLIISRIEKEQEAMFYFKKMPFYAKLIRSFPFVSGIAISGSLSKNVIQEDGDIDYFIITKPGRLWITRSFLVIFKKVVLFNSKKYFCVNYFIDENNLVIPDKNIFTAVEICYLLPVYNVELIRKFKVENEWVTDFIQPFEHPIKVNEIKGKSWIARFFEFSLTGRFGDWMDLQFMKLTYKRWEKKFKNFDAKKFELTMRTNRGVSKHHPRDFQNKVLKAYRERLSKLNIVE